MPQPEMGARTAEPIIRIDKKRNADMDQLCNGNLNRPLTDQPDATRLPRKTQLKYIEYAGSLTAEFAQIHGNARILCGAIKISRRHASITKVLSTTIDVAPSQTKRLIPPAFANLTLVQDVNFEVAFQLKRETSP